ncbi:MAG: hypothetical protein HY714_04565 [Candidatus Omnitrophica bacterium]|nr:hypothetical protein [Candidatus Omnitrophota bacterium]
MQKFNRFFFMIFNVGLVVFALSTGLSFGEDPNPELVAKGRELFNAKEGLGVKFACIMCHKGAKAVKKAKVEALGDQLPSVINKYIVTKGKGKEIAPGSPEMQALIAYIKLEHSK